MGTRCAAHINSSPQFRQIRGSYEIESYDFLDSELRFFIPVAIFFVTKGKREL